MVLLGSGVHSDGWVQVWWAGWMQVREYVTQLVNVEGAWEGSLWEISKKLL